MNAPRLRCLVFLALAAACTTSDDEAPTDRPLPDDAVFEETVVELSGDTARVVSTRALTVGEARRDNTVRTEQGTRPDPALVWDSGCSGAALWLYDRADGTGNRICFIGAGTANLQSYWRFADGYWQTWEIGVGSLWPGVSSGYLLGRSIPWSEIDAGYLDPRSYNQVWEFPAWGPRQPFYGFILYGELTLR